MRDIDPIALHSLLATEEVRALSDAAKKRLAWIAFFVENGRSVSETCAHFGISRSTLHRWLNRFDPANISSLEECETLPSSTFASAEMIEWIREYRTQMPLIGKEKIHELLERDHHISLSSSTIGRIIERECLYFGNTPLHWRKRMTRHQRRLQSELLPERRSPTLLQPSIAALASDHHDCVLCRLHRINWKPLLRTCVTASILMNLAFVGFLIMTAMWEQDQAEAVRASLIESKPSPHSDFTDAR